VEWSGSLAFNRKARAGASVSSDLEDQHYLQLPQPLRRSLLRGSQCRAKCKNPLGGGSEGGGGGDAEWGEQQ
jgi:hypothetical protein